MELAAELEKAVLTLSEDLVRSASHKEACVTALDFEGTLSPPLQIYEDPANGCGGQTWPAGMLLASYMLREPQRKRCVNKSMSV